MDIARQVSFCSLFLLFSRLSISRFLNLVAVQPGCLIHTAVRLEVVALLSSFLDFLSR